MSTTNRSSQNDPESAVYQRYAAAAQQVEPALCCAVEYSADLLAAIPQEVIERDYGCGDPTPYVRPGETVLDLGSGTGKLCFIAAQLVGAKGSVIGVDINREMLALARHHAPTVAERVGYRNVDFRYGFIQDLQLDVKRLEDALADEPVSSADGYLRLRALEDQIRNDHPLVADNSVDCVLSNCVLNLVRRQDREQLFHEIFRVLRPGSRAAISDIVASQSVPEALQQNSELWSGCISGAFREEEFVQAFEQAGFYGIEIAQRQTAPWRVVEGIEFRSMTLVAHKGPASGGADRGQTAIYRGPFKQVVDDAGQTFRRGERTAIDDDTFAALTRSPYKPHFECIDNAPDPQSLNTISSADSCCGSDGCC